MPTRRRTSGRALVSLCALVALLPGCREEALPPDLPPRAIQWAAVSGTLAEEAFVISGIVTAISDTTLAFEVGGTLQSVEVNLGDPVDQGQVLARLDPEPFELAVRDGEAALAEARSLRELARTTAARFEAAAGAVPQQDIDRARAERDSRTSQVEAAQARLNLARRDLRRSVLSAPFRGVISAREIDPAMNVAGGQTVFALDSEESGLRVEVQMPETRIVRVKQGAEVQVAFPSKGNAGLGAAGQSFPALVSEVGTRAGVGNAFPVRADLLDRPRGLRPGMTAEVTFSLPRGDAALGELEGFMIPVGATLAEADDRFSVFVYDSGTSVVNKRAILIGGVRDNEIAVLEGLEEGEIIATAGVPFLRDGQPVTLLDEQLIRATR
jgi:RND family efflux transporter MFP subunit